MTKKLLGLLTAALFCVSLASASTSVTLSCTGAATANGSGSPTPTASGTSTCPGFTIPLGDTLTSVEIVEEGSFQLGQAGGNTLVWTFSTSTPNNVTSAATETVTAPAGSANAWTWSGNTGCSAPDTVLPVTDGEDCTTALSLANPSTTSFDSPAGFTVGITGAWQGVSPGLNTGGSEGAQVDEVIYTYSPTISTPEPASLLMIGGGLLGLGLVSRRKRQS